jgi:hypothetical protein
MGGEGICSGCLRAVNFDIVKRLRCDFGKSVTYLCRCRECGTEQRKTVTL